MVMSCQKILVSGISYDIRRNIFFQAAVYWAEQGCKVLYLTRNRFESIPSAAHGPQIPSSEVLAKIRIVYLEKMEELLKFIVDILTFRDSAPRVILVEEVEGFVVEEETWKSDANLARVCATLCHVTSSCSVHSGLPTYLLVSLASSLDKTAPVVCTMFDTVWSFDGIKNTLTRRLPLDSCLTPQLTFVTRFDGAIVLKQVNTLFSKS